MQKPIIHFILSAVIGLGLGYVVYDVIAADGSEDIATSEESTTNPAESNKETNEAETSEEELATATGEENILQSKGCIGCHAVGGLGLDGGATGPDLTQSFGNVEGKHGKPLDEFLKEPTSAVMATVIGGSPLTEDEIAQIVEELRKASESN